MISERKRYEGSDFEKKIVFKENDLLIVTKGKMEIFNIKKLLLLV